MLQIAVTHCRGSDYERAVGYSIRDGSVFLGVGQNRSATHRGTRLTKGALERVDDPQVRAPEIAHGAGGRANVERISCRNENDAQAIEFAR
jgi:hypothetical protein